MHFGLSLKSFDHMQQPKKVWENFRRYAAFQSGQKGFLKRQVFKHDIFSMLLDIDFLFSSSANNFSEKWYIFSRLKRLRRLNILFSSSFFLVLLLGLFTKM